MKLCYVAYNLYHSIFETEPQLTGMYQWMRVFNADSKNLRDFHAGLDKKNRGDLKLARKEIKARVEKYDVIMVNSDPADCRLLLELRDILGENSSTELVLNQDHSPELWTNAYEFPQDFKIPMQAADHVFATSPAAQKCMQALLGFDSKKKVHLCPHPCETHALKHMRSVYESDHLIVFWHRYQGGENFLPYVIASQCYDAVTLVGHMDAEDRHLRRSKCTFKKIWPASDYPSFVKTMLEARFGFEPFQSYTYGRTTCDSAAVGLPVVGNRNIFSMQVNYPLTCVDPYDATKIRELFERLNKDPVFYQDVHSICGYNSSFFSHEACRERFMKMLEGDKPVVQDMKALNRASERGEVDSL